VTALPLPLCYTHNGDASTQDWVSLVDLIFLGEHTERGASETLPATTQNATPDSCTHVSQDAPSH